MNTGLIRTWPTPRTVNLTLGVLLLWGVGVSGSAVASTESLDSASEPLELEQVLEDFKFRNIGPYRGGRVTAVTGVGGDRDTFYMGSTGGGVWKTFDGGVNWSSLGDSEIGAGSIGAVDVSQSDPNVVWVGTGSACPRGNISPGRGVFRSVQFLHHLRKMFNFRILNQITRRYHVFRLRLSNEYSRCFRYIYLIIHSPCMP